MKVNFNGILSNRLLIIAAKLELKEKEIKRIVNPKEKIDVMMKWTQFVDEIESKYKDLNQ